MIETLILWLPIPMLVGVFLLGFGIAWWLRAEDARQMRAELKRRAESYDEMAAEALTNARKMDELHLGWQAVRAAVEQHTVAGS